MTLLGHGDKTKRRGVDRPPQIPTTDFIGLINLQSVLKKSGFKIIIFLKQNIVRLPWVRLSLSGSSAKKYLKNTWKLPKKYFKNTWKITEKYFKNTWKIPKNTWKRPEKYLKIPKKTWKIPEKYLQNT